MRSGKYKPMVPVGSEALSDPVWKDRIKQLIKIIPEPLTIQEIHRKAFEEYKWASHMTTQVLAAGEGKVFFNRSKIWKVAVK
jgi:hypothetical protein